MLDAIKGMTGGGKSQKRAEAEELEALIAKAREERGALDAMVTTVRVHSAKLTETGKSLEQVTAKAAAAMGSLDAVAKRIEELERRARGLVDVEQRAEALDQNINLAQARLADDYENIRATSREAREDAAVASAAVKDIENKMGRFSQLQELSQAAEGKLAALNALAEHITQKTKVLTGQKHVVDRAAVEANRVDELVWNMGVQIDKLNEGVKHAAQGEEAAARLESLTEDLHERLGAATRARDGFMQDSERMERDGRALAETVRNNVEKLALEKTEFEALSERLYSMREAVQDSEQRMEALGQQAAHLGGLPTRLDEFANVLETLTEQAHELSGKQASLDTLRDRLSDIEDLSARAEAQYESLTQSRADVEAVRAEIHGFQGAYAEVAQLRDRLGADRAALEGFVDRLASFRVHAPELDRTIDAILQKMPLVEQGARHAERIGQIAEDLDAQVSTVTERLEVLGVVQGRLDTLHAVATDVENKLATQLSRRTELDTLQAQCDSVTTQMLDTQQKIGSVATRQGKILRMETRLTIMQDRLDKTAKEVKAVQRDEAALAEQEARLTELAEVSRSLAAEASERVQQAASLTEQLGRSTATKSELIDELARIQARQREAVAQVEAAEDQLRRTETMYRGLEQRRSQLAFSDKKLGDVEAKMSELTQTAAAVEQQMKTLVERGNVIVAVKAEIDSIHEVSAKSREDLQYMSDRRGEVAELPRVCCPPRARRRTRSRPSSRVAGTSKRCTRKRH